jgi:hypothetical protein
MARALQCDARCFLGSRDRRFGVTQRIAALFLLFASVASTAYAGEPNTVPEPVTGWLLASGLVGLGVRAYRKHRQ